MRRLHGLALLAVLAACGKPDKHDKPTRPSDAAAPAVVLVTPPPGSLAGKEPPTAESAHVELAYALARWAATEHANVRGASVKTWLDPGTQLPLEQSKVIVDHIRELMWQRTDGQMHLFSDVKRIAPVHDDPQIDAALLGTDVIARFTIEGSFAWLVLENPTGAQVVVELWPEAPCQRVEPTKLTCNDKQFTLVAAGETLTLSPDRTIKLAKDAKLTFK